ncbi:hypothetical protein [Thermogutta sp.]|uniref:hypothetical protein n=1 Tax=Thermogutta sp. TaxID=1962930 RepID=UPI003220537E
MEVLAQTLKFAVSAIAPEKWLVVGTRPGTLWLASSQPVFVRCEMPVEHDMPDISVAVPASVVVPLVDMMSCTVAISFKLSENEVEFQFGRTRAAVKCVPRTLDFPAYSGSAGRVLSAKELANALGIMRFVNRSDSPLGGVLFESDDSIVRMVCTDSYRLTATTVQATQWEGRMRITVPIAATQLWRKICRLHAHDEQVSATLLVGSKCAALELWHDQVRTVAATELLGEYPDVTRFLNQTPLAEATVAYQELSHAIKMAATVEGTVTMQGKFPDEGGEGTLTISSSSVVTGGDATATIAGSGRGQFEVHLDPHFLVDALSVFKKGDLAIQCRTEIEPVVLSQGDVTHVVMPLILR